MLNRRLKFKKMPRALKERLERINNEEELEELGFCCSGMHLYELGFKRYQKHWRSWLWYKIDDALVYTAAIYDQGNTWCDLLEADIFSRRIMQLVQGDKKEHFHPVDEILACLGGLAYEVKRKLGKRLKKSF